MSRASRDGTASFRKGVIVGIGLDTRTLGNDETTWTLIAVPHDS